MDSLARLPVDVLPVDWDKNTLPYIGKRKDIAYVTREWMMKAPRGVILDLFESAGAILIKDMLPKGQRLNFSKEGAQRDPTRDIYSAQRGESKYFLRLSMCWLCLTKPQFNPTFARV